MEMNTDFLGVPPPFLLDLDSRFALEMITGMSQVSHHLDTLLKI